jgi:hypothetical protein
MIIKYVLKINIYQEDNLWLFNNYNLEITIYNKNNNPVYTLFDITLNTNKQNTIMQDIIIPSIQVT